MLAGHDGAVLEVHWTADGTELVSASVDQTCMTWDAEIGCKIRRFRGHKGIVNGACPARKEALFVSGSDDGTMKVNPCLLCIFRAAGALFLSISARAFCSVVFLDKISHLLFCCFPPLLFTGNVHALFV